MARPKDATASLRRQIVGGEFQWYPNIGTEFPASKTFRHYPDDRVSNAIDFQLAPKNIASCSEAALPQIV
jgi:hypothetical protein